MRYARVVSLLVLLVVMALTAYSGEKGKMGSGTITGTLVDTQCYIAKGSTGNKHGDMDDCGTMCARAGIPVAVLSANNKLTFVAAPAPKFADAVGSKVEVTGMLKGGAIVPEKFKYEKGGKWVDIPISGGVM